VDKPLTQHPAAIDSPSRHHGLAAQRCRDGVRLALAATTEEVPMAHTIRLHRVLQAPPERIYRAFTSAAALAKWMPPHGFVCEVEEMDARIGGRFHMAFINLGTGERSSFGGTYLELVPNVRIRNSDQFDDPSLPGSMTTTVDLRAVPCGTEVQIVQEGVPAMIPAEACYLGWQQSLQLLALLVEAHIPSAPPTA
jgi:uncharacterized protein YndB with AHSA1/START domain